MERPFADMRPVGPFTELIFNDSSSGFNLEVALGYSVNDPQTIVTNVDEIESYILNNTSQSTNVDVMIAVEEGDENVPDDAVQVFIETRTDTIPEQQIDAYKDTTSDALLDIGMQEDIELEARDAFLSY